MAQISEKENIITDNLELQYLVRAPRIKAGQQRAIILLHGVGSNEQDLFSFAEYLPDDLYVISARGQIALGAGRFGWYNVDFSTGKPNINAAQELSSRGVIKAFIGQVKRKYNVDEVYLGGFSQGAIMSFSVALNNPDEIAGVVSLSGRILDDNQKFIAKSDALKKLKVFLAHGTQDGTLPVHYARQAKAYLENLGVQLSYREHDMGHQINGAVLNDLVAWLTDQRKN